MKALSSANTSYTKAHLTAMTGISAETLANWGLLESTDALTLSELTEKAASDAQAKTALEKIITQNAQAVANGEVTAATAALTASEEGATLATGTFTTAIKANISSMIKWMTTTPVGKLIAIVGSIFLVAKAYDALTVSVEEQKEKMEASASAYKDAQKKISDISSELQAQEQEMDSLHAKNGLLTNEEERRLKALQKSTKELRVQQDLAEQEANKSQRETATEASDLFRKQFGKYDISDKTIEKEKDELSSYLLDDPFSQIDSSHDNISKLIALYETYDDLLKEAYNKNDQSSIDTYKPIVGRLETDLYLKIDELKLQKENMSDFYNNIKEQPSNQLSTDEKNIIDDFRSISDAMELIYNHLDPLAWKSIQLDNVFSTEGIEKTKEELIEMEKAGELNEQTIQSFPKLLEALKETKLSAKELHHEIKALAAEEFTGLETPVLSLTEAKSAVNGYSSGDTKIPGLLEESKLLKEILSDTGNVQQETYEKLLSCSLKYAAAVKNENGLITINTEKLKQVASSRQLDTKEAIQQSLALKKQEWVQWNNNIENYNGTLLENITANYENIDALQAEITQYELLANSIDNTSNAFSRFKDAQSTNDQDMYDTAEEAFHIMKEYSSDKSSDNYLKYNRDEFQESAMFLMDDKTYNKAIHAKSIQEYQQVIDEFLASISPLFDENNAKSASRLFEEVQKIMDSGNAPKADTDWAKRLGISEEAFHALKQMANQYGFNGKEMFESHNMNTLEEYHSLLSNIKSTQEALNAVTDKSGKEYMKLSGELDTAKEKYDHFVAETADKISEAYASYSSSEDALSQSFSTYLKQTLGFDDEDITGSIDILLEQADILEEKMSSLPISSEPYNRLKAESDEISQYLSSLGFSDTYVPPTSDAGLIDSIFRSQLDHYESLQNDAKEQMNILQSAPLGSVTYSNAEENLRAIQEQMENLKEPLDIKIHVRMEEVDAELDSLKESLSHASNSQEAYTIHTAIIGAQNKRNKLNSESVNLENSSETIDYVPDKTVIRASVFPDFTQVKNATVPDLTGKVKYFAEFQKPAQNADGIPYYQKLFQKDPEKTKKSSSKANGTFHAFSHGTPFDVSIRKNEKALVNELGEEGLVRNGKLIPIRGGTQFLNLRRGDIIFNHRQMEQLRKNGYTTGRGKLIGAHGKGTVYDAFNSLGNTSTTANSDLINMISNNLSHSSSHTGTGKTTSDSTKTSAKDAEKPFEQFFNWLERRLKNLQRVFDKWIKQAETALTGKMINKYYKKAAGSMKKELNTYGKSYDFYMGKARETGLNETYAKKVRNGTLDPETVTDEDLAEQIGNYQEWYDKAIESTTSFLETAEKLYNLPLEKAAAKIELFKDAISLLDKKLGNAIGHIAKNSLIDQKTAQEKKTLNTQKKAKKESKKNLKRAAKDLKSSDTLKDSGLTAKEKKKLKKRVTNRKEIDISSLKEGSKAYNSAVKYNEALKAKKQSDYDLKMAAEDYNAWLVEAAKAKFDNIANDYEKEIKKLDYKMTAVNNEISEIEAAGKKVNISQYEKQKSINDQILAEYQAEKAALEKSITGIKEGTDEWYSAYDQIRQIDSAISGCKKETYALNNAIQKLHFDLFDDIAESIGRIITEQEFLQGLTAHEKTTDDKTGSLTDAGYAKLGSSAASYYAAKNRADKDAAMVKELQEMVDKGVLSNGKYTFNSIDDLEAKLKEMYSKWQGDIKETYSKQSAVVDMMKEQYKAQLAMVKDLIDAKKKSLNAEKDLHNYQKSIQEKTDNISTIKKQIAAYSGDTSQEGLAKLQKLQKELVEKQNDLKETEYDRYLSDQQELLDKLYEEYDELTTKKMDDFMGLFQEGINLSNDNTSRIADYLSGIAESNEYIEQTKGLFDGLSDSIEKNVNLIIDSIVNKEIPKSGTVPDEQGNAGKDSQAPAAQTTSSSANTGNGGSSSSASSSKDARQLHLAMDFIAGRLKNREKTKKDKSDYGAVNKVIYENKSNLYKGKGKVLKHEELIELADLLGVKYDNNKKSGNLYQKLKSIKFPGFKKGGIVSVDDIARQVDANGDDGIASVKNGEGFISAKQMPQIQNLLNKLPEMNQISQTLSNLPDLCCLAASDSSRIPSSIAASYHFTLENCTNAEDIIRQIQQSKKVQNALRSVTLDRLADGGRLSVRSIQ